MRKYLAFDDRWIQSSHAVHRRPCSFVRDAANPVLTPEHAWEGQSVYCFGSVFFDPEHTKYRMWYQVYHARCPEPKFETAVGYAESVDGKHWQKPRVGAEHPKQGATNLVWLSSGRSHLYSPAVVRDVHATDPQQRYRMLYWDAMTEEELAECRSPFATTPDVPGWKGLDGEGAFICTSPDGIHWQKLRKEPVFSGPCDATSMSQLANGSWLATVKTSTRTDRHFRIIAETHSADGLNWTAPQAVLQPDWHDLPGTEFYGMPAFDYFGYRLGLIWIYHNTPDDKRVDVQLAYYDTERGWQRTPGRHTLLTTGERGEWDAGCIYTASQPIVSPPHDPDAIWLYYGGANVRHDDQRYQRDCIGLAKLRLDGFASLDAGHFAGTLKTQPMVFEGDRLRVNADTRHGQLEVVVRDAITQAELARSQHIEHLDSTHIDLHWQNGWQPHAQQPVQLEFQMQRTRLYSFSFE